MLKDYLNSNIAFVFGSISLATLVYLYHIKRSYSYLRSLGYDGPDPKFFVGNLADFASKENSIEKSATVSHYSKTLRRWTKKYGKIYGFYEGHSPVLVIADPDLVTEVFVNQSKLNSYRRSFPMSKDTHDPTSDIFTCNGIRWLRVRYGLEKVMLNTKTTARCLEYVERSFNDYFIKQLGLTNTHEKLNLTNQVKLFMVQTMFAVIFGIDLNTFIYQRNSNGTKSKPTSINAQTISHRFEDAFHEYESFSLLKFFAILFPEFRILWRGMEKFKRTFNAYIFPLSYFADPMDWFHQNFIKNNLDIHSNQTSFNSNQRGFGYFDSFIFLTFNPIIKYNQNESAYFRTKPFTIRNRAYTSSDKDSMNNKMNRERRNSLNAMFKFPANSRFKPTPRRKLYSTSITNEIESQDFENWKLTIDEALSNTLLMFFAGYETTAATISFCCKILSLLPEEREKLVDEIRDHAKELQIIGDIASAEHDETDCDDVFEEENSETNKSDKWSSLYEITDKMKYLDMFVREVLRMFPIANSMVSRKCVVNNFYIDGGNYHIPNGMNIVVDVLSIHYDKTLWGPIDPEIFYPERFLTERNPAAWLPFGNSH
jgi:cytochrome P450